MTLSLRTRLTIWYSALLLLVILLFSATVLWLQWRLVLRQSDESLGALSATAANVVMAELAEHATLAEAAAEAEAVVRQPDYAVSVFDGSGAVVRSASRTEGIVPGTVRMNGRVMRATLESAHGPWRVTWRRAEAEGNVFTVAVAAPMHEVTEQWWALFKACAIGIPFVLGLAMAGGWLVGRRALRPLADIAAQAGAITAPAPDQRLRVPEAVPELEIVARSFNRVLDRLGTAIETQRQFMADASHELRTPVSIMRTAADVTLSQPARDEGEYRDALLTVSQQTSRLARMVDDMLMLARSDAGGYPITRAEMDLDETVRDCIRELEPRAAAKRIRVTAELQPVSVVADEMLVRRMLENLVVNAITYTVSGGSVHVRTSLHDQVVSVQVADTGPGIPVEDRERVFERFVRLDPARGAGGAGLGLSIARWIAEAHGGRVVLVRSSSEGSVFAAMIPAA